MQKKLLSCMSDKHELSLYRDDVCFQYDLHNVGVMPAPPLPATQTQYLFNSRH